MSKKNHYEILGVDKSAAKDEIKKAYRDKAKKIGHAAILCCTIWYMYLNKE